MDFGDLLGYRGSVSAEFRTRRWGSHSVAQSFRLMVDRRQFLEACSAAGLSGLFPGALYAQVADEDDEPSITTDHVAAAEAIAGISLSEEERELLVENLNDNLGQYEAMREQEIPNARAPASVPSESQAPVPDSARPHTSATAKPSRTTRSPRANSTCSSTGNRPTTSARARRSSAPTPTTTATANSRSPPTTTPASSATATSRTKRTKTATARTFRCWTVRTSRPSKKRTSGPTP